MATTSAYTRDTGSYKYVGRFAPSPTGPLHFGSLVAALASWLDARSRNGVWFLRIEDLDPPRESATAPDIIRRQLEAFGLTWDGEPLFQSRRQEAYDSALKLLKNSGRVFPCSCSRKSVRGVYPGTCRHKKISDDSIGSTALRFKVPTQNTTFTDRISGVHQFNLNDDIGDFIVRRRDGKTAYQLAVVVDDEFQGITDVVRGDDLLDSTPRQQCLIQALGYKQVRYTHLPVILGSDHQKLSKQAHAAPLSIDNPAPLLREALQCLGQLEPPDTQETLTLLEWAMENWRPEDIPLKSIVWAP